MLSADYAADPQADVHRPVLQLDFTSPVPMPDFKIPLPGGAKWLLTTEIGGYDCLAQNPKYWPDQAHTDATGNYYSIDFTNDGVNDNAKPWTDDVPVLAAASGVVTEASSSAGNGNYVVIDHDGDNNPATINGVYNALLTFQRRANCRKGKSG